jgi:[ribosomal protein S18]-alanine N-acetyltransferase
MAAVMTHEDDRNTCRIRRATLADVDAIMGIESLSFSTPWPRSAFVGEIKAHSWSHVFVAELGDTIVGFMIYWTVVGEIHLLNLAVHPSMRTKGIGTLMVERLIANAREQAQQEIILERRESNHTARRLYERFGFRNVTRRKGYYADNGEDAIVMNLTLEDSDPDDEEDK